MAQAKAHPTLLRSFGTQTSAGIKYGDPGISKSFSRDDLWTLGKGVLYGHSERSGVLYGNHIYIVSGNCKKQ